MTTKLNNSDDSTGVADIENKSRDTDAQSLAKAVLLFGVIILSFIFMVFVMLSRASESRHNQYNVLTRLQAEKVLENHPDDYEGLIKLGDCNAHEGMLKQAIANYSKAIEKNPTDRRAYLKRATAFDMMHDSTQAQIDVESSELLKNTDEKNLPLEHN